MIMMMNMTIKKPTELEQRQELAAKRFIEAAGYRYVQDIEFVPDETEPLNARSVHVTMPTLRFTHWTGDYSDRRTQGEISAVSLEVPTR